MRGIPPFNFGMVVTAAPPTQLVGAGQHLGGGVRCDGWPPGPAPEFHPSIFCFETVGTVHIPA